MPLACMLVALLAGAYVAGVLVADAEMVSPLSAIRHWFAVHATHRREIQGVRAFAEMAMTGKAVQGPGTVCGALSMLGMQVWWPRRRRV